jgi:hypothetical protein
MPSRESSYELRQARATIKRICCAGVVDRVNDALLCGTDWSCL